MAIGYSRLDVLFFLEYGFDGDGDGDDGDGEAGFGKSKACGNACGMYALDEV